MSRHAYHFAANVKFIFTHILRFSPRILLLHAWTVPSGILVSAGSSFFAGALVETIRNGDLTAMVCVTAGFIMGSVPGVGTLITACFMGPLITFFDNHVSIPLRYGKKNH